MKIKEKTSEFFGKVKNQFVKDENGKLPLWGTAKKAANYAYREGTAYIIFVVLFIFFTCLNPTFASGRNIMNLLRSTAPYLIAGMGIIFVMMTGGIDLSVGYIAATSACCGAMMINAGVPSFVAVLICIVIGFLLGSINGVLAAKLKVFPLIITLATQMVFSGLVAVIAGKGKHNIAVEDQWLNTARFLDLPVSFWIGMESVLNRIIQMAIINEFEYTVYSAVDTPYTVEDYADILNTLCAEYGISDGVANAFSQYTIRVSCANPCYYISYGVSLVPTIDLFIKAQENYKVAQECYRILQEDAAEADGFKAALALAGIGSPFDESTFLNIKEAFDIDAVMYNDAVQDALLAEESEIRDLVTLTEDDERVSWNEDGKVLLLTLHKYPDSYVEGTTSVTGSWYMWTVTDGEIIDWYAENQYYSTVFADKLKQVLGMPISSTNTYISAVWVDVADVIRPAYQPDPTKQLTAEDLDGSSLGIYEEWFNSNIISSYCSTWGQYPWTRLGYTYNWDSEDVYGLSEFVILPHSEITVEFTKTLDDFAVWLYEQISDNEVDEAA